LEKDNFDAMAWYDQVPEMDPLYETLKRMVELVDERVSIFGIKDG